MKRHINKYHFLFSILIGSCTIYGQAEIETVEIKPPQKLLKQSRRKKIIFSYENREFTEIINEIALYKKANLILPQGKEAIKGKVSYSLPKKISIDEAWNILITLLDIAGFLVQVKEGEGKNTYIVVPKENTQTYQPPVFINSSLEDLPNEDSRIRYVYYFSNIALSISAQKENLTKILDDMLPSHEKGKGSYYLDEKLNVMIIAGNVNRIKMILGIIKTFDETGFAEAVEVISLKHIPASIVESLFSGEGKSKEKGLIPSQESETFIPWQEAKKQPNKSHYFSERTRVVAISRINSIIIFGTQDGIDTVKNFIAKYIDVPLETGKSIVRIYELNFLDAHTVKTALDSLLSTGEKKQSKGENAEDLMYDFSNVIIRADEPKQEMTPDQQVAQDAQENKETKGGYLGGNRLIIACRKREWKILKPLIDDIDNPQPQIAIDALIVDLTTNDARTLGMQLRNSLFPNLLSQNVNFQSAHLNNMWLNFDQNNNIKSPPGVASNLLSTEVKNNIDPTSDSTSQVTLVDGLTPNISGGSSGNTVVSFNEKGLNSQNIVWGLLQLLNTYKNAHILSRPFVIVANNGTAELTSEIIRLLVDEAAAETSGPVKIDNKDILAGLIIKITPRLGSHDDINLTISIKVNEFTDLQNTQSGQRIIREINTNAILQDQQLLMLGGLDKITDRKSSAETPLISRVPLVGWFFKKKNREHEKQTLMVFLVPRIIKPKVGGRIAYISDYTKEKIDMTYQAITEERNDKTSRDFVDRNFFGPISGGVKEEADKYFAEEHWQHPDSKQREKTKQQKKKLVKNQINDTDLNRKLKKLTSSMTNPLGVNSNLTAKSINS